MKRVILYILLVGLSCSGLAQNPIRYLPNGNANDESGNGNNGTVNGATFTTVRFGNANSPNSFDGINSSPGSSEYLLGKLDDVRINNHALSTSEISTLILENVPTITSFAPTSGPIGTTVTITGTNFSTTPSDNIVYFGATMATVSNATATQLTVTVPSGATYHPVSVAVNGLVCNSSGPFNVTFPTDQTISTSSFAASIAFGTGLSPYGISTGDLDGDGKVDVVTANSGSNNISVLRNNSTIGSVSFETKADFAADLWTIGIAIADLDGDGKLDIAATNYYGHNISIFRNTSSPGSISFETKIDYPTNTNPFNLAIADLDYDGKLDIVIPNYGSDQISIYKNNSVPGIISFLTKVDIATGDKPYSVDIGDLDADGKVDIGVTNDVGTVSIFRNTTVPGIIDASSFSVNPLVPVATLALGLYGIFISDTDRDGKLDINLTHINEGRTYVLRNISTMGTISFETPVPFNTTVGKPWGIAIGDIDGDGRPDHAIEYNTGAPPFSVFKNNSTVGVVNTSTLAPPVDFPTGFDGYHLTMADIDEDDKPEIIIASYSINAISVFQNTIPISEPISQPSAISFSNVTDVSMTVSFSAASGTPRGYIGLRKTVSSPTEIPSDGTTYSVGNTISTSTVAFVGSGTSFSVTGLLASTVYYYDIFSYNGTTGTYNYLTTTPLEGSQTTFAAQPTAQPTTISFSNVTDVSMTASFTAASGTPGGYIGLRKTVSSPTEIPIDGTTYSVGNTISTSTVAFMGSGTSFSVTGLLASSGYYYDIYSYNGTTGTYNYLTTTPLEGSQTTLASQPTAQPTTINFSNVTDVSMTASFTAASGTPGGYIGLRKTVSSPTEIPIDGTTYSVGNTISTSTVAFVGSGTSFSVTGLLASTVYYYDIFSYNGTTGTYNYLTTTPLEGSQTTNSSLAEEPTSQPTALIFSDVQSTSLTLIWTTATDSPVGYIVLRKTVSSPTDVPSDGTLYTTGNPIGTSIVAYTGSAVTFVETGLTTSTTYYYDIFSYNGNTGSYNYLIASPLEGSKSTLPPEPTTQPTSLEFLNVTGTSMTVSYAAANGNPSGYVAVRKSGSYAISFPSDDLTYTIGSSIEDGTIAYVGTGLSFIESGLTTGTDYFYQIYSYNSFGGSTNYLTSAPLTGNKILIDITKPVITHTPVSSVDEGTSLTILSQLSDEESEIVSGTLFFKSQLTNGLETTISLTPSGSNWIGSIPSASIGELGVEYWISTLNGAGLIEQTPHYHVPIKHTSNGPPLAYNNFGTSQSNYRIISFPYQLDTKNAGNVFDELGQFDEFNWRLSHWTGAFTKELVATDPIETGWGYWLLVKNNPGKSLTGGPGKTVTSPFNIDLKQGWNQIGNPYNFNIDWSDIQQANPLIAEEAFMVYTGDGSRTGYVDSKILRKMEGGFVEASQAFTLNFPPSKSTSGRIKDTTPGQSNPFGSDSWNLALNLTQGEWLNYTSGIGMRPDALIGYDKYDDLSLPRLAEYIDLHHETTINRGHLSKDIVPTTENYSWKFKIESNNRKEFASIEWNNSSFGESEQGLFLFDENDQVSINMSTLSSYEFKTPREFKILFGNPEYLSKELSDGKSKILSVSPNPSKDEVKIIISLAGWRTTQPIKIELINTFGQFITHVYTGNLISGSHELFWKGLVKEENKPTNGIYFLKLTHASGQSFYRIVLLD